MNDVHVHSSPTCRCLSRRRPVPPRQRPQDADARDVALLRAFREGDREAFWSLWMTHAPRLFSICLREMNGHRPDAEDALQEAMLRAYARLPRFAAGISSPASWLTRITSNVCKDLHRRRARDARMAERVGVLAMDRQWPEAEAPASAPCDPAILIDRLPPPLRDVFVLRVLQQASYTDIASRLGVTNATARKRVQQSRAALRAWRDAAVA